MSEVSTNYKELTYAQAVQAASLMDRNWQNSLIAPRQYEVVVEELRKYRRGENLPHFDALRAVLRWIPQTDHIMSLLDVGAASGYYSEVLRLRGFEFDYTAVDYSSSFKELAESKYPGIHFDIGDARDLPYENSSFDIVLHSGCILHMMEYEKAISEAARVSKRYVVFHRTPIAKSGKTVFYQKRAYGIPCIEIHFEETELLSLFLELKLNVVIDTGIPDTCHKTYLLEKK